MIRAKYTIVLKTLLDDPQSKALIDKALSTYPLYDAKNESKFSQVVSREDINKALLNYYKYREIGFETFGRFLDELETSMNEIMPYYNQLLVSQDVMNGLEDMFENLDVVVEFESTETDNTQNDTTSNQTANSKEDFSGSSQASSTGTNDSETSSSLSDASKHVSSETPQGQIDIVAKDIDSVSYADKIDWNKNDVENSGTSKGTTTTEQSGTNESSRSLENDSEETISSTGSSTKTASNTVRRKGNQGVNTYAHDMLEFRELLMNVVQKIITDKRIAELFMGVY